MTTPVAAGTVVLFLSSFVSGCAGPDRALGPSPTEQVVPAYTLSGVVLGMTPTGLAPIEGAWVQVNLVRPAMTGADGTYAIPGLTLNGLSQNTSVGPFNVVTTWKPGFVNDSKTVTIPGDTRLDIQLERRATFTLSGVVSEITPRGHVPLAGVQIDDWSCDPTFPGNRLPTPADGCNYGISHRTTTDGNGRFSIPGVYASRNFLCATKEGFQATSSDGKCDGLSATLTLDGDTRFDFVLARQ